MSEAARVEPQFQVDPAVADEICDWLAEGVKVIDGQHVPCTLAAWCRQPGKPHRRTVYKWIAKDPEFAAMMEGARQIGADGIADDMLRIADTPMNGTRTETEGVSCEGKPAAVTKIVTEDMLGHRRLQIYTREKLLAKWHPKRYGERHTLAGDPDAPLGAPVPVIQIVAYSDGEGDDKG